MIITVAKSKAYIKIEGEDTRWIWTDENIADTFTKNGLRCNTEHKYLVQMGW